MNDEETRHWMVAYEDEIADLLRTHEQDVREKVAQAIEAMPSPIASRYVARRDAALIARDGGRDD